MSKPTSDASAALSAHLDGDPEAAKRLLPLVYEELRALASRHLAGESPGHTLQATALVHEAYLRLIDHDRMDWGGRTHFLALAATTLRRVLVDHARARKSAKRGGGRARVALSQIGAASESAGDPIDVSEALDKLSRLHGRQARVVELRHFGGLSVDEVAETLSVSRETVKLDWRFARSWLNRELQRQLDEGDQ